MAQYGNDKLENLLVALEDFCSDDNIGNKLRGYFSGQDYMLLKSSLNRVQDMLERYNRDR